MSDEATSQAAYKPGEPGARNGQRVMLTRGPNRLIGRVSSDSVTWITLRLDAGCALAVDLDGWTMTPEPTPDYRPRWVRGLERLWGAP